MKGRAPASSDALVERALRGEHAAMARLMTRAEAGSPECRDAFAQIYAKTGFRSRRDLAAWIGDHAGR